MTIHAGKVKFFDDEKGWGFIIGNDGYEVFVHRSGIIGSDKTLRDGDFVEYRTYYPDPNRTAAKDVKVLTRSGR